MHVNRPTLNEHIDSVGLSDPSVARDEPTGEGARDTAGDGLGVRNMPRGTGRLRSMVTG